MNRESEARAVATWPQGVYIVTELGYGVRLEVALETVYTGRNNF